MTVRQSLLFEDPAPLRELRFAVLGSGSRGNAFVVESGPHRVLVDAGFSGRETVRRLEVLGLEPEDLDAIVLTHEHGDHLRGAPVLARRFRLPVFGTRGTLESGRWDEETRLSFVSSGRPFEAGGFEIEAFEIPHDAREPVGLVITDRSGCRVGLAGDLGCRSRLAWARLREVHGLLLETNHDLEMLRNGPYPWHLKQRISGRHGHLSNRNAVEGLPELLHDDLQWVVGYHLSQTNNRPPLVESLLGEELERRGSDARVVVTEQDRGTGWMAIEQSGSGSFRARASRT